MTQQQWDEATDGCQMIGVLSGLGWRHSEGRLGHLAIELGCMAGHRSGRQYPMDEFVEFVRRKAGVIRRFFPSPSSFAGDDYPAEWPKSVA